jgi:CarD family transcriptional regulator
MFEIGDLVMYGARGVCRVKEITELDWSSADQGRKYYVLDPLYKADVLYVPIDNDKVFMRHVMSREEVLALIDSMPDIEVDTRKARSIQQLARFYQAAIDSHECEDLVKLTKSIHRKKKAAEKQNKQLGQIDVRYMQHGEDLLFGEIAAVLEIPRESVVSYIDERLASQGRSRSDDSENEE